MQFTVLNRDSVNKYRPDKRHILIQIYCHSDYAEPLEFLASRRDVLKLQFDDLNAEQKILIEGRYPHSEQSKKFIYFSEMHAKQIIEFINKHLNNIELIVTQCDAGISRSAAVAAALSKCINGDDAFFFRCFLPNSLVYKTILEEWHKDV